MKIFHVDAFASRPFEGNPAAVCLVDRDVSDDWMQRMAAEMNLSETAFVRGEGADRELRWFTPTTEVDLCGHATLAAAHVLWESGAVAADRTIAFRTRSGVLPVVKTAGGIEMDFPASRVESAEPTAEVMGALGVDDVKFFGRGGADVLVEAASEAIVRSLRPDFAKLRDVKARGVIVTARSDSREFDFVSRFFAPAVGIDEDPVTGSAHAALGPYWERALGKSELAGYQASSRGGIVRVSVRGARVGLAGAAVTISRGSITSSAIGR